MRRISTALSVVLLAFGCSETRSPVAPSPTPTSSSTPPSPSPTQVRGVVYEVAADGRRPLAGVGLDISPEYQSLGAPVTVTNAEGRFTAEMAPRDGLKIAATKTNYSQPCRVPVRNGVADYEVYLVSNDILSMTGVPSSLPITGPVLTGRVFELTPAGEQTIAGASFILDFSAGFGWSPSANTVTDATGHYLLCNVVNSTGFGLGAVVTKPGYNTAFVDIGLEPPPTFDVELSRH